VQNGVLAGSNFWAFNGLARPVPGQTFWKPGDDFMGDPPMEEQSLYGVFDNDGSTWKLIREVKKKSNKGLR
jgi:mannan endo-1,4-beta-mannosidase